MVRAILMFLLSYMDSIVQFSFLLIIFLGFNGLSRIRGHVLLVSYLFDIFLELIVGGLQKLKLVTVLRLLALDLIDGFVES